MIEISKRYLSVISLGVIWCASVGYCQDGFQNLQGQHIDLTTDLESAEQAQELVDAFDAATPQWESFWNLPAGSLDDWKVRAYVMVNKNRFAQGGLIPAQLPNFRFGFAMDNNIWVVAQKSEYYTRHLLLHEGVHALAFDRFNGAGPSWFMEGSAELLSVHTGKGDRVKINQVPTDRELVSDWGRFTLLNARRKQSGIPSLATVLNYPRDMKSDVESYGWSWAAVMLLSAYPEYQTAFQKSARNGSDMTGGFNLQLRQTIDRDWPILNARWRLMCHNLDYGFDWQREQVKISMADKLWDRQTLTTTINANQGWQSVGPRFGPGMKITIRPDGQVTLANTPKPWVSEPPGVTIRYYRGKPLGQLQLVQLANLTPTEQFHADLKVQSIEQSTTIQIKQHCWLLLRVNDFPGELGDNSGGYQVTIQQ